MTQGYLPQKQEKGAVIRPLFHVRRMQADLTWLRSAEPFGRKFGVLPGLRTQA